MKHQAPRPDIFIFPVSLAGDELAAATHALAEGIGKTVVDTHEIHTGFLIRVIQVHGKRPGEGQIAKDMKERKK